VVGTIGNPIRNWHSQPPRWEGCQRPFRYNGPQITYQGWQPQFPGGTETFRPGGGEGRMRGNERHHGRQNQPHRLTQTFRPGGEAHPDVALQDMVDKEGNYGYYQFPNYLDNTHESGPGGGTPGVLDDKECIYEEPEEEEGKLLPEFLYHQGDPLPPFTQKLRPGGEEKKGENGSFEGEKEGESEPACRSSEAKECKSKEDKSQANKKKCH